MSAREPSRTHRWLAGLLACVLALAPFLHGHFGATHESGFHIDGLHAVHHASDPGHEGTASLQASDDESPALGVAPLRPPSEDGGTLWWPIAVLLVLPLLPLAQPLTLRPASPQARRRTRYRLGLPPPSLAPPLR